ncbi:CISD3 protein, partial [Amia calva]|nr:CISD3 protein [Amia calva]
MSAVRKSLCRAGAATLTLQRLGQRAQCCSSRVQPVVAARKPFKEELQAGKRYAWCACGHSKKQPFCDGAHKHMAPGLSPVRFTPEKDGTAWLCGCKHTASAPYCDGTHKQDFVQQAQIPEPQQH